MGLDIKYIIITPVRNEEAYIEKTLESVIAQTIRPIKWIIVDDGSTDNTAKIIEKYTFGHPWISLIKISDRGYYDLSKGGEIKAFYIGYKSLKDIEYDFIAKLDGDISFDEKYFEALFAEFRNNLLLGIASGACYYLVKDKMIIEKSYTRHVRGAARVYRKECWEQIGGPVTELGWDAVDVYKARMLGWETRSFEQIKMIHHVKTGTKAGVFKGRIRLGRVAFLMGMHPLFFSIKAMRELFNKPYILGAMAYLYGYFVSLMHKEKRIVDKKLMEYIRREQFSRLLQIFK
jgi:poly-beta-1,6-N-acetyl-D-glucosamine synthase